MNLSCSLTKRSIGLAASRPLQGRPKENRLPSISHLPRGIPADRGAQGQRRSGGWNDEGIQPYADRMARHAHSARPEPRAARGCKGTSRKLRRHARRYRGHYRHGPQVRGKPTARTDRHYHGDGTSPDEPKRPRHSGDPEGHARPVHDLQPDRGPRQDHHPRPARGRQPPDHRSLGRRLYRRRELCARLWAARQPSRHRAHRGTQRSARYAVRQEHHGRRDQYHHQAAVLRGRRLYRCPLRLVQQRPGHRRAQPPGRCRQTRRAPCRPTDHPRRIR